MLLYLTYLCLVLPGQAPLAVAPHQYADGFIERSLALVIRDQRAYGEYSVGLNTATAALVEARWRQHAAPESAADEGAFPVAPAAGVPGDGVGEHLTDPQTIDRLGQIASPWILDHLKVSCNQQPVKLEKVTVEPAARHPFSFTIRFEIPLSVDAPDKATSGAHQVVQLSLDDRLFSEKTGAVRYALKGTGRAMILQSNVAPILVRAERTELETLSDTERDVATRIEARLAVPRPTQ